MTRATYNADNTITELPGMDKPEQYFFSHKFAYEDAMAYYNAHLATLRTIPCSPECRGLWAVGQKLEEGKDYEVRLHYHAPDDKELMAFPLSVKSEDDLHYEYAGKLAHCLGITISGADWEAKALPELKRLFSLTKR